MRQDEFIWDVQGTMHHHKVLQSMCEKHSKRTFKFKQNQNNESFRQHWAANEQKDKRTDKRAGKRG